MKLEIKKINDLIPAPYNPRKDLQEGDAAYEDIKRSIQTLGYNSPIIVDEAYIVIDGNQRLKVLKALGYEEIEVIVVDLDSEDKKKALAIALDKVHGEWDMEKLYSILVDFEEKDLQELIAAAGVNNDEFAELKDIVLSAEANDDDFDLDAAVQEAEKNPIVKRGEIWQLGEHRLMCGDSTSIDDVNKLMAGVKADLIITDPPYNVDYGEKVNDLIESGRSSTQRSDSHIKNDKLDEEKFREFMAKAYKAMFEACREGALVYVFHADTQGIIFRQEFKNAGFKLAQILIWEKNGFVLGRQDYQWKHKPIIYGWKEGKAHYFVNDRSQDTIFSAFDDASLSEKSKEELLAIIEAAQAQFKDTESVIYENKPLRSDIHPTMKPVSLYGKLINNSSRVGEVVADYFAGSGTLFIAAEQLKRKAYAIEYEPTFCDAIIKRWEEYTGQKAKLLNV